MSDTVHQWLVRRGRIGIVLHVDDAEVELQVDPEGSRFCVLDLKDASELASILTGNARALWERFQTQPELHGTAGAYTAEENAMTWQTAGGDLPVHLNAKGDLIAFGTSDTMNVRLRIRPLTELIQWLQTLVQRAAT